MIKVVLFDNDGVLFRWMMPQKKVWQLAKELKEHNIRTGVFSNVHRVIAQIYKLLGAYQDYDIVLLSYREKMKKPQKEFYDLAVKRFKVKPEEILFIDDREHWLKPATDVGIKTIHSRSTSQIIHDIKRILLKENGVAL